MPNDIGSVFFDDGVTSGISDIIRTAKDHIILVSPYNKFWIHLRDDLTLASKRGVKIIFIYRSDETPEELGWFANLNATIYAVERLHEKIFLNESSILMTSMNLVESSSKNSKEIAIRIDDKNIQHEIRQYVLGRLIPLGVEHKEKPAELKKTSSTRPARSPRKKTLQTPPPVRPGGILGKILGVLDLGIDGYCVRCSTRIPFDTDRPLCDDCYAIWNQYGDPEYEENICHHCGKGISTSYARPLCFSCYKTSSR